jgi:hypothetical protein
LKGGYQAEIMSNMIKINGAVKSIAVEKCVNQVTCGPVQARLGSIGRNLVS